MNFIQKKIHHLRQQPEDVKLKAISRFTIIAGIVLVILWAALFLPLQLRLRQGNPTPTVAGSTSQETVTPTSTPPPRPTITPQSAATIKLAPTSEDKASPEPSSGVPVETTP